MGGSTNSGITSGLDQPRQQYNEAGRVQRLTDEFQQRKSLFDQLNPNSQSGFMPGSASSFLTNFGLNLMAATPRGNIFQTAAVAAKDPFNTFQAARAQERADQKRLDQEILGDVISEDFKSTQQQKLIDANYQENLDTVQGKIDLEKQKGVNANEKLIQQFENDKALLKEDYELQKKYGMTGAKDYAKKQAADAVSALYDNQITAEKNKIEALDKNDPSYQAKVDDINSSIRVLEDKKKDDIKSVYLSQDTTLEFQRKAILKLLQNNDPEDIAPYFPNFNEIMGGITIPESKADGGRIGLAESFPGTVGDARDSMKASQEDVQNLSYSELRTRLPQEISDEIVVLLANSKQALLDFANIKTGEDVASFNQQYDVNLTLPQGA
tara:strand:- start:199 stop:1344 length:1146 start_codon:yes stop_codon:yes gene_type:complete